MATQIPHPGKDPYDQDFYAWSRQQAELPSTCPYTLDQTIGDWLP
jgi:hypothetical protein